MIGMQVMTQICTPYGKARFYHCMWKWIMFLEKCMQSATHLSKTRVLYREAAFELAHLSLDKILRKM